MEISMIKVEPAASRRTAAFMVVNIQNLQILPAVFKIATPNWHALMATGAGLGASPSSLRVRRVSLRSLMRMLWTMDSSSSRYRSRQRFIHLKESL